MSPSPSNSLPPAHSPGMHALITGALTPPLSGPVHGTAAPTRTLTPTARLRRAARSAPDTSRPQHAPSGVQAVTRQLHRGKSALAPGKLPQRDVSHFYPAEQYKHLVGPMRHVMAAGGRLYVRGLHRGVGVTTFLADYARVYNYQAALEGDDRRLLYVAVPYGTGSVRALLDMLADAARAPLSSSEISKRSPSRLLSQCVVGLRSLGVVGIVIDHVHNLGPKALPFIADLLFATDPAATHVPLELDAFDAPPPRLAVVLASHVPPTQLLRPLPHVRQALRGCYVRLNRYRSLPVFAEAVRLAGVGLEDLDLEVQADRDLAQRLLEVTEGMPAPMNEVLSRLDAFQRFNNARPDLVMLEQALDSYRPLARLDKHLVDDDEEAGAGDEASSEDEGLPSGGAAGTGAIVRAPRAPRSSSAAAGDKARPMVAGPDGAPRSSDAAQQLKQMQHVSLQTSRTHKALLRSGV